MVGDTLMLLLCFVFFAPMVTTTVGCDDENCMQEVRFVDVIFGHRESRDSPLASPSLLFSREILDLQRN